MEQENEHSLHQARIFTLLAILFLLAWSGGAIKNFKNWVSGEASGSPTPFPVISRVYYQSPNELQTLSRDLDVREIHDSEGYIVVRLPHEKMDDILKLGYRVEPAISPTPTATP